MPQHASTFFTFSQESWIDIDCVDYVWCDCLERVGLGAFRLLLVSSDGHEQVPDPNQQESNPEGKNNKKKCHRWLPIRFLPSVKSKDDECPTELQHITKNEIAF